MTPFRTIIKKILEEIERRGHKRRTKDLIPTGEGQKWDKITSDVARERSEKFLKTSEEKRKLKSSGRRKTD